MYWLWLCIRSDLLTFNEGSPCLSFEYVLALFVLRSIAVLLIVADLSTCFEAFVIKAFGYYLGDRVEFSLHHGLCLVQRSLDCVNWRS